MNNFKFFQEKKEEPRLIPLFGDGLVFNQPVRQDMCDYLFQFNDYDPVCLGRTHNNGDFTITLRPHEGANIIFGDNNNNTFKIFARPVV